MKTATPKEFERWEKTRKKGQLRYVLERGVLGWGVPMFAIITFLVPRPASLAPTPGKIALSAVIWAIGGALFGKAIWSFTEKRYQKYLASVKTD